jgi:hypothetical protein
LLDLCGIDIPESVEGISMIGDKRRDLLYCEVREAGVGRWLIDSSLAVPSGEATAR